MQNFISQTALYGNTVIHSKHEHNFVGNWGSVTLQELNRINSIVFRFALANYVCLSSLGNLISRLENGLAPVTRPHLVNAFAIVEIREAYEAGDLDTLYHIQEYLHNIAAIGTDHGLSYQDQVSNFKNNWTMSYTQIGNFAIEGDINDSIPDYVPLYEEYF